jgi:RNA polymerase sigma-70 factor, ECF subfamily
MMMTSTDRIRRLFLSQQFRLMDYIGSLVRQVHDAEDIFQEVSLVILGKEDDPTVPTDPAIFAAWCRGVARNHVLHYWRARGRRRIHLDERIAELAELAFTEAEGADDAPVLDPAHRLALSTCLEHLDGTGRDVLEARYVAGRTCEDIAQDLGKAAGGVRMLLMRLRDRLRQCIETRVQSEGPR